MIPTTITSRVGADGILSLAIPLSQAAANEEVRITVEPLNPKPTMTHEEWAAWVKTMAGSITDPTFRRHEQGDYEVREELL
jgi:hypothetical protein